MFEHPHAMSCKYTNIGALTNLLPWLLKCRAACRVWLFSLLHPESPDEYSFLYDHTSLWGQGCPAQFTGVRMGLTTHLASITSERGVPPLYFFVDAAFLQGLFRFKIRRRIVVFSLLFYSCSYSDILQPEPWSYHKPRGFPRMNCSKLTLLVFQVRSGPCTCI